MTRANPTNPFPSALGAALLALAPVQAEPVEAVRVAFRNHSAEATAADRHVVEGRDGWLFLASELRFLASEPFWGGEEERPPGRDPYRSLADLHARLAERDVRLLVVPVPARLAIYPDMLLDEVPMGSEGVPARVDPVVRAFVAALTEAGVEVLDLTDAFRAARTDDAEHGPVCCEQDTHWSPRGMALAAQAIADRLRERDGLEGAPAQELHRLDPEELAYTGDLVGRAPGREGDTRTTIIRQVSLRPDRFEPPSADPESPGLVLADSHGLVFQAGRDMHATGAGLPGHLGHALGFMPEFIARRGSGAVIRRDLARRFILDPDSVAHIRVVVYLFAARELTESDGWTPVPLARP